MRQNRFKRLQAIRYILSTLTIGQISKLRQRRLLALITTVILTQNSGKTIRNITLTRTVLLSLTRKSMRIIQTERVTKHARRHVKVRRVSSANRQCRIFLQLLTTIVTILTVVRAAVILTNIFTAIAAARATITTIVTVVTIITVSIAIATTATRLTIFTLFAVINELIILLHKRHNRGIVRVTRNLITTIHEATATAQLVLVVRATGRQDFNIIAAITTTLKDNYLTRVRKNRRVTNLVNLLTQLTTNSFVVTTVANVTQFFDNLVNYLATRAAKLHNLKLFNGYK